MQKIAPSSFAYAIASRRLVRLKRSPTRVNIDDIVGILLTLRHTFSVELYRKQTYTFAYTKAPPSKVSSENSSDKIRRMQRMICTIHPRRLCDTTRPLVILTSRKHNRRCSA